MAVNLSSSVFEETFVGDIETFETIGGAESIINASSVIEKFPARSKAFILILYYPSEVCALFLKPSHEKKFSPLERVSALAIVVTNIF